MLERAPGRPAATLCVAAKQLNTCCPLLQLCTSDDTIGREGHMEQEPLTLEGPRSQSARIGRMRTPSPLPTLQERFEKLQWHLTPPQAPLPQLVVAELVPKAMLRLVSRRVVPEQIAQNADPVVAQEVVVLAWGGAAARAARRRRRRVSSGQPHNEFCKQIHMKSN